MRDNQGSLGRPYMGARGTTVRKPKRLKFELSPNLRLTFCSSISISIYEEEHSMVALRPIKECPE